MRALIVLVAMSGLIVLGAALAPRPATEVASACSDPGPRNYYVLELTEVELLSDVGDATVEKERLEQSVDLSRSGYGYIVLSYGASAGEAEWLGMQRDWE